VKQNANKDENMKGEKDVIEIAIVFLDAIVSSLASMQEKKNLLTTKLIKQTAMRD
jgi:hypothetical protein